MKKILLGLLLILSITVVNIYAMDIFSAMKANDEANNIKKTLKEEDKKKVLHDVLSIYYDLYRQLINRLEKEDDPYKSAAIAYVMSKVNPAELKYKLFGRYDAVPSHVIAPKNTKGIALLMFTQEAEKAEKGK